MPDWTRYDPQLHRLHAEQVTPAEMARRLDLAPQTVRDRLIKLGLLATRPRRKASPPATAAIAPVSEMTAPLSPAEAQTLERYERIIAQGINTFIEVGRALLAIREQRLYRQAYGTFEEYLRRRWDLSRPRAYQLIDAAQVVDTVSTIVDIVPMNEAQARPLASLAPEQQREAWQEAVKTAPPSGLTADHVKQTVKRLTGQHGDTSDQAKPKPQEPKPRRPARQEVQEGLIWGLREVNDKDAWEMLGWMWEALDRKAPQHPSLRAMLDRVRRRFPSVPEGVT
jgi:hypothetical protein